MVDGIPFATLGVCIAVLFAWLVGVLRDRRQVLPLAEIDTRQSCGYQRSSWTISAIGLRPPGLFGAVSAATSAG